MESSLIKALEVAVSRIQEEFSVELVHETKVFLKDIVEHLQIAYPEVDFKYHLGLLRVWFPLNV